uniref:PDZ and LIM domain 5b n=1 Tax=Lepisosteus oculatus TaxID=7918 RepID=W5N5M3_LEPOC
MPLTISRLNDGGKATKANIAVGDVVLSIDGISTESMNHLEAQNKIKSCTGSLNLTLQKASSVPKPAPAPAPKNSPINLYSNDTACEVAEGQRRGLKDSQGSPSQHNGKSPPRRAPRKPAVDTDIEFYHVPSHGDASKKRLMEDTEDWHPRTGTSQSRSFRILAQITGTERLQEPETISAKKTKLQFLDNPLQALPKCAPHPPPVTRVLKGIRQIATLSRCCRTYSSLVKSHMGSIGFRNTRAPCPPPMSLSSQAHGAAATISAAVRTQARLSGPVLSPSLLDALLITPVSRPPPLQRTKDKRRTTSALYLQKNKSSEAPEPAQPSSHVTSAVKTMTKAPGSAPRPPPSSQGSVPAFKPSAAPGTAKSTSWQATPNTGHVAPAFGHMTNSTPKAPVAPAAVCSAPQPHPTDEDTLVQRAEHIPAGKRTPMCGHCNMVIRGPFLLALGKAWHPEEFNCAHCKTSLAEIGFVEEKGSVYCEHCYEQFFAPTCGRCQRKILGEIINALKQTWHVYCFLCAACQQPIRNNVFHLEDGEPYCDRDYYNLFGTSCHGCDFPIEAGDKFLEALGYTWHDTCFVCAVCCTSLEGQAFFSKKDKPLCKKHAHTVRI